MAARTKRGARGGERFEHGRESKVVRMSDLHMRSHTLENVRPILKQMERSSLAGWGASEKKRVRKLSEWWERDWFRQSHDWKHRARRKGGGVGGRMGAGIGSTSSGDTAYPTKRKTITPPPHTELERDAPVNLENQLVSVRDREEKSRRKIESQI